MRWFLVFLLSTGVLFAARLTGRVVDAETGQPIPATITIRTVAGRVITDHPSFQRGFRSPGTFDKEVPAGALTISVRRGFDYAPQERKLVLREAEHRDLRFRLRRRSPLRRLGWYCGDSHVHMIHGEHKIEVDFPYIALAARAEGLDYLSVCQQWNLPRVTPEALENACAAYSTRDFTLTWNLEAPKNYWRGDAGRCMGHGWTLGMRGRTPDGRDAVAELLEMSAWDYESNKPPTPNFEIQSLIHSLGGIVSYTHPHRWWWGKWGGQGIYPVQEHMRISNMAAELPFDTVAGPTYDTLDLMMQPEERETNRRAQELWFLLLNHGYRIAGTASSDATFDNPGGGVPGKVRVYTRVEGVPTVAALAAAMKAGRNFATSGPLLRMSIGGHQAGDVVRIDRPVSLQVKLEAWADQLARVELLRNGEVVRSFTPRRSRFGASFTIRETRTAWYIARAYGAVPEQVAIMNPVYFEGSGYRAPAPAAAHVEATVRTPAGIVEVIEMDGRTPRVRSSVPFSGGRFSINVPATARLRVGAETRSVFMDFPPLLSIMLEMTPERLSDWRTFEQCRRLLQQVRLEF